MKHSLEEQIQLHNKLLTLDDVCLFTKGGCHVFALALYERFGYPIRVILGHSNDGIAHIYCQFAGPPNFAVDVIGFTPEDDRMWKDFGGLSTRLINRTELLDLFKPLSEHGMCGEDWFVRPARQRADRRIEAYIDIFSGERKVQIG
jgi:hypothetical protein